VGSGILSRGKCAEIGVEDWGGEAPVDDEGLGSELMACASRGGVSDMMVFKERVVILIVPPAQRSESQLQKVSGDRIDDITHRSGI
jgi:hypothetical protein